jgi:hypothetical protein
MWTYDIAREQSPDIGILRELCDLTLKAGFNAIGLYLEHRFAFECTAWAHGRGAVTPAMVRTLQDAYGSDLQIIPFVNLLGHFEGFLYTEHGKRYAEERFRGMQADSTSEAFVRLANDILDETIQIFTSQLIHIGGDETQQLGLGCGSRARMEEWQVAGVPKDTDLKARIYAEHFGPLAQRVVDAGRTPAVWGDMFHEHPTALDSLPIESVIFDWQYFRSPEHTSAPFRDRGHRTVLCPTVHTYNAVWAHLPQSERNIRDHVQAANRLSAEGVCVTTWECGLFGSYEALLPVVLGAGRILQEVDAGVPDINESWPLAGQGGMLAVSEYVKADSAPTLLAGFMETGENDEEWARLMGVELPKLGPPFAFSGIRSSLKCRLLLYGNPFLAWLYHHEELCGDLGLKALGICDRAIAFSNSPAQRGVTQFVSKAIEFVRFADEARQAYAQGLPGVAIASLSPCRQIFEDLQKVAVGNNLRFGGSLADIERCRIAKEHVEKVIFRVKEVGDGSLGYLPAWEIITHPKFCPHDQASWWLINSWANE